MIFLTGAPAGQASSREMAKALSVSEAHLSKVLHRLARAGLLRSTRGPKGGFALSSPPKAIRLLDVYEAIEGPLLAPTCLLGKPVCGRAHCPLGGLVHDVNSKARSWLAKTKLSHPGLAFERSLAR
jgi:Rrf2 family protein